MTEEEIREARAPGEYEAEGGLIQALRDRHRRSPDKLIADAADAIEALCHTHTRFVELDARHSEVLSELDGARSGALLLREEIDALRGMVEERDAEIERLRGLLGLVEEAQERIRARGNPLASLTSEEVRAARESDLPEICGRLAPVDRNGCYWPRCEYTHDGPPCDACDQAPRPDPADQALS